VARGKDAGGGGGRKMSLRRQVCACGHGGKRFAGREGGKGKKKGRKMWNASRGAKGIQVPGGICVELQKDEKRGRGRKRGSRKGGKRQIQGAGAKVFPEGSYFAGGFAGGLVEGGGDSRQKNKKRRKP